MEYGNIGIITNEYKTDLMHVWCVVYRMCPEYE